MVHRIETGTDLLEVVTDEGAVQVERPRLTFTGPMMSGELQVLHLDAELDDVTVAMVLPLDHAGTLGAWLLVTAAKLKRQEDHGPHT